MKSPSRFADAADATPQGQVRIRGNPFNLSALRAVQLEYPSPSVLLEAYQDAAVLLQLIRIRVSVVRQQRSPLQWADALAPALDHNKQQRCNSGPVFHVAGRTNLLVAGGMVSDGIVNVADGSSHSLVTPSLAGNSASSTRRARQLRRRAQTDHQWHRQAPRPSTRHSAHEEDVQHGGQARSTSTPGSRPPDCRRPTPRRARSSAARSVMNGCSRSRSSITSGKNASF